VKKLEAIGNILFILKTGKIFSTLHILDMDPKENYDILLCYNTFETKPCINNKSDLYSLMKEDSPHDSSREEYKSHGYYIT
jgi:hypothetical protein